MLKNKFNCFFKNNKKILVSTLALVVILLPNVAFAEGSSVAVDTSVLTSTLTSVANSVKGVITEVAPTAIGVTAVFLVWKYGVKFFKSLLGK